jgi:hypothetical protein
MNIETTGGGPLAAAPGITNASGLNNVGLLVKIYGKSSDRNTTTSEFNIVDGYGVKIRVYAPGLTIPADNAKVVVTGISGADNTSGSSLRVLRAKSIQVLP